MLLVMNAVSDVRRITRTCIYFRLPTGVAYVSGSEFKTSGVTSVIDNKAYDGGEVKR